MVKLKKKRGGESSQRRRPTRMASDMTKDEAALAIQKSEKRLAFGSDCVK